MQFLTAIFDWLISLSSSQRFKSHDSTGQRIAFFPEDNEDQQVADMIRDERLHSASDMDLEFSKLARKVKCFCCQFYSVNKVTYNTYIEWRKRSL